MSDSDSRRSTLAMLCLLIGCNAGGDENGAGQRASTAMPAVTGMQGMGTAPGAASGTGSGGDNGFGNALNPVRPLPTGGTTGMMKKEECAAVSQQAENRFQPADIIIGIDTSSSMSQEAGFVQENMNAFSQQITDSGVDVRVIVVASEQPAMMPGIFGGGGRDSFGVCIGPPLGSGMCPADSKPPVYTHINTKVDSRDVLSVLINAYPSYKQQLRPDSAKHFVSITDDDATDPPINTAQGFITAVQGLEPAMPAFWSNWHYSSIYCFTACEQAAQIGAVHADLVKQTTGVGGDLCLQDFKPVFDELAKQVLEGAMLACDWEIPAPPGSQAFDAAKTNVRLMLDGAPSPIGKAATVDACGDLEGWHYDDETAPARVVACPATCTRIQAAKVASVDILFGCETEPVR